MDGNLTLFQTSERPVAHSEFGGTLCGQDGLAGCHWFDLTPGTLQLFQKLTSALYRKEQKKASATTVYKCQSYFNKATLSDLTAVKN